MKSIERRKKMKKKSLTNINLYKLRSKRKIKEIKKNKRDRKSWRENAKKKWIWKMLQDTFRESGNGSKWRANS